MAITINGTSGISGVDGHAGTPALQGSDPNTGISFGTDEVNINTGGSTRATVDSSGRVLVGTSSGDGSANKFQVTGNTSGNTGGNISLSRGAIPTAVNQTLGLIAFGDGDGDVYAEIKTQCDGAAAAGDAPGRLVFSTTADGASSPTEQMRLTSTGDLRFNSGFGSVATAYGVRAWVNFNGAGTLTVRGSGNISSVTDNGVGQFAPNFTNAMPDTNYAGVCSHIAISGGNDGAHASPNTTSAASIQTGAAGAWRDPTVVCAAFFR